MHTIEKGDLSVAMLVAAFLRRRIVVLTPLSQLQRYDLVIDRGLGFERVQCKTGRLRRGAVVFNACSSMAHHGLGQRNYRGQADLFGVYCLDNDRGYLVPVDAVGCTQGKLRVDPARNGQKSRILLAETYAL